ncbi:MAG: VWA domain-containing protein [Planctomycetota bacterium]|nr:VWA domain-containing protein [Planctomycetales bacterium]RLS46644.1 MAG: VWA domain-containing protein [Planctomycetota bacterium]
MNQVRRMKWTDRDRRGAILVLAAVFMTVMLAFVAFAVDMSYMSLTKTQLQAAADASALAGAMELSAIDDPATVRTNALAAIRSVAALHRSGNQPAVSIETSDVTFGKMVWNSGSQTFSYNWGESNTPYNIVKVRADRDAVSGGADDRLPLLFAPALGHTKATIGAEAVASFQPRDIMVVLDFSASMNDDSCFGRIGTLGRSYIESNLLTMWRELGSPVYGNLTFTPAYAVLKGVAASGTIPHIDVTYKRKSVDVVSTINLTQVKLQFSSSSDTQTFTGLSAKTGTFAGTGSKAGKDITAVWVKSGTNGSMSSGSLGEQFTISATTIKTALGLNGTYPYAGGSWSDYISKVQASSGGIYDAGYRDMYGYMTWIEYMQMNYPSNANSADLWKTSEQPIGVLKDGVTEFINYLTTIEAEDHVGLSIYTHTNSAGAILEHALSTNLTQIKTTTQQRQAGHYTGNTNISAGMAVARQEIEAHARPRAFRMMVVMTDGLPNLPSNSTDGTAAVITEANAAKASKIKILAISLGVGADTSLMQQIADITGGVHYNVPGGSSIDSVRIRLQEVFRQIASSRPLKLIKGS